MHRKLHHTLLNHSICDPASWNVCNTIWEVFWAIYLHSLSFLLLNCISLIWVIFMHNTGDPITKSGAHEYIFLQYFSKNKNSTCGGIWSKLKGGGFRLKNNLDKQKKNMKNKKSLWLLLCITLQKKCECRWGGGVLAPPPTPVPTPKPCNFRPGHYLIL